MKCDKCVLPKLDKSTAYLSQSSLVSKPVLKVFSIEQHFKLHCILVFPHTHFLVNNFGCRLGPKYCTNWNHVKNSIPQQMPLLLHAVGAVDVFHKSNVSCTFFHALPQVAPLQLVAGNKGEENKLMNKLPPRIKPVLVHSLRYLTVLADSVFLTVQLL
jgi:hypothetical protein